MPRSRSRHSACSPRYTSRTRRSLLAREALEKLVALEPQSPRGHLELAQLLADSGDLEGSLAVLKQLTDRVPADAAGETAIAQIQLSQKDWGAVQSTAERIRKARPDDPIGYYLAGLALQQQGRLEESVGELETALEKSPTAAQPLIALARGYVALKQPEKAEARLKQLLAEDPASAVGLYLLGDLYTSTDRLPQAKAQYQAAIEAHPTAPLGYSRLAAVQGAQGDAAVAVSTLRSGLEATGHNAGLAFELASRLDAAGQFDEAAAVYEEMLKRDPALDAAANNLAALYANHRAEDPQSLSRALELAKRFEGSEQAVLLDTLGWVHYRRGDYPEAAAVLERAAARPDAFPELSYHLGMTYLKLGRTDDARERLAEAVKAPQPFPGIDEAREVLKGLQGSP